jgi:hypothetical protein
MIPVTQLGNVRSEVLVVEAVKIYDFWDVTSYTMEVVIKVSKIYTASIFTVEE